MSSLCNALCHSLIQRKSSHSWYWCHALGFPPPELDDRALLFFMDGPVLRFSMSVLLRTRLYSADDHTWRKGPRQSSTPVSEIPRHLFTKISNPQILLKMWHKWRARLWGQTAQACPRQMPPRPKHTDISLVKSFKSPKFQFMYVWDLGRNRTFPQSSVDVSDSESKPWLVGIWHRGLQN